MKTSATPPGTTVPAWYAEMKDPDFHKAQCQARSELLAMMMGRVAKG